MARTTLNIQKKQGSGAFANFSTYSYQTRSFSASAAEGDASGNLLLSGAKTLSANDPTNLYILLTSWTTLLSSDSGTTWMESDNYVYPSSSRSAAPNFILKLSNSDYLVGGKAIDTSNYQRWIVRRGQLSGSNLFNWSTVDDFHNTALSTDEPKAGLKTLAGSILVIGNSSYSSYYRWIVRRGNSSLSSWTTTDSFQPIGTINSFADAITQDSTGRIYVLGHFLNDSNQARIRSSDDDGISWTTLRSWNAYSPKTISVLHDGRIVVVGVQSNVIYIEVSSDRGQTWTSFAQKSMSSAVVNSVRVESDSIFLIGSFKNNNLFSTTLRIKLSAPQFQEVDSSSDQVNGAGLNSFLCSGNTWCLLNSQNGPSVNEFLGSIRRMSP